MSIVVCLVTCPSKEVGAAIAKRAVEQKLAACVNILSGVQSIYRWKEEVSIDEEVLLVIKTSASLAAQLQSFIEAEHPYEVPEFVALSPSDVSKPYERWVLESVE